MGNCNHEPNPKAGYGATTGVHICKHCGLAIWWTGKEYTSLRPTPKKDNIWVDVLWGLCIALVLATVSALRHW